MNIETVKSTLEQILLDDFEADNHEEEDSLEAWPDRDKAIAITRALSIITATDEVLNDLNESDLTNHGLYDRLWDALIG